LEYHNKGKCNAKEKPDEAVEDHREESLRGKEQVEKDLEVDQRQETKLIEEIKSQEDDIFKPEYKVGEKLIEMDCKRPDQG
jgi:hypothetical protein